MGMRRSSPRLIGRDADLHALEAAVDDRAARPLVLIAGEAGVGKSRLLAEYAVRARADGELLVRGSCIDLGADHLPYAPFVDALGRLVDALGAQAPAALGTAAGDLRGLLPDLGGDPGGPVSRGRLYEAVRSVFDRSERPLLVFLEDVQWADVSSLELLAYLAAHLRAGRAALVATFRTDEVLGRHPLLRLVADLERSGRATRIDIERLRIAEAADLVRAISGELSDAQVAAIVRRAGGNPFLLEEVLAAEVGQAGPLPETLRELLLSRLATLGEGTARAVAIVALIGRPADHELIAGAWEGSSAELDLALRDAVDRAVLVVEEPARRLAFRHALIGEAVAEGLLPGPRMRVHAAIARALAQRPDLGAATRAGAAAELAHHLREARDVPASIAASIHAGDEAAAARAYPEALGEYERALQLLDQMGGAVAASGAAPAAAGVQASILGTASADRVALLDAAAEAAFHSGDAARAVRLGRQALATAQDPPADGSAVSPRRLAYLTGRLLEWAAVTRELEALAPIGEEALARLPADEPSVERALLLLSLASAQACGGRHRRGLALASESASVAAACGAKGTEAGALSLMAVSLVGLGRDAEAWAAADRAVALADQSRGAAETALARINQAAVYSVTGRYAELAAALPSARLAVEREGLRDMAEAWLSTDEFDLLVWNGSWAAAEALATRVVDAAPAPAPHAWLLAGRGLIAVRQGRQADGERDLLAAAAIDSVEPDVRAAVRAHLAEAALIAGDPATAIARLEEGLALLETTDDVPGRARLHAIGLAIATDMAERARARRDAAVQAAADDIAGCRARGLDAVRAACLEEGGAVEGRVAAWLAWGAAETGRRRGEDRPATWRAAAEAFERIGERYLAARCRSREAEVVLATAAQRGQAADLLRGVRAFAERVGAAPLAAEAEALARRARLELVDPAAGGSALSSPGGPELVHADPYGLSQREREVLALLVDGRSNREIGERLFITEKTASTHVTHILDKLGVASRGAAAALAARGGWLEPEG